MRDANHALHASLDLAPRQPSVHELDRAKGGRVGDEGATETRAVAAKQRADHAECLRRCGRGWRRR